MWNHKNPTSSHNILLLNIYDTLNKNILVGYKSFELNINKLL